ncbi:hypothetical protein EZV62_023746 [Acer yangbiense]|uniref:Uncharacterized protein n=1 Tax=Acer yangbiense TaxID=1000413 RepID=A0A5C7H484_9ROSI|nr:hypothetical protein EZV62_023746 [Acer yangbiense]
MEAKDPFGSISDLCHVSSSQEDRLRRCRFAHEPEENDDDEEEEESEDSGEIPTGIIMVSPPDSSAVDDVNYDSTPDCTDIFQTPPEGSFLPSSDDQRDNRTDFVEEEAAGGCTEEEKTVDLGADTDLRFLEVELTQRLDCENEVIDCESDTIRVLKRDLVTKECLRDSQLKKQKTLGLESPSQRLVAELGESRNQSNSNRVSPHNCGSKSLQNDENDENSETFGESFTKRKLHFSSEVLELETEASDGVLGFGEGLENIISDGVLGFGEGLENIIRSYEGYNNVSGFSEGLENIIRSYEGYNNGDDEKITNLRRKRLEDLDQYRFAGPSANSLPEMMRRTKRMRTLPDSVCGQAKNVQKELDSGKNQREISLLDVLRMLSEKRGYDRSLENKSILEVAKSRGMTFP